MGERHRKEGREGGREGGRTEWDLKAHSVMKGQGAISQSWRVGFYLLWLSVLPDLSHDLVKWKGSVAHGFLLPHSKCAVTFGRHC
jgi:hypothetical protein